MNYGLWKTVDNFAGAVGATPDSRGWFLPAELAEPVTAGGAWRACSACAGDYEDPDRTAWTPDRDDEEAVDDAGEDRSASGDEVPDL